MRLPTIRPHSRAVAAPKLAQTLHVPGCRVAKSVIVNADGNFCIAVVPSTAEVDLDRLADVLGVERIRLADENEFAGLFPDCELGSEPQFGKHLRV